MLYRWPPLQRQGLLLHRLHPRLHLQGTRFLLFQDWGPLLLHLRQLHRPQSQLQRKEQRSQLLGHRHEQLPDRQHRTELSPRNRELKLSSQQPLLRPLLARSRPSQ